MQLVQMLRATEEEAGAAPAAAAAAPAAAAGVAPAAAGSNSPMYHAQADDWEATYLDVPEVPRRMFSTRVYRRTTRSANPALDLHANHAFAILELKNKLKDLDAIYHQYEGETAGSSSFVPTTKHLEMHKSLTESLNFSRRLSQKTLKILRSKRKFARKNRGSWPMRRKCLRNLTNRLLTQSSSTTVRRT